MKHLDVVDGVLAAVPVEERPVPGIIGQNLTLLILKLRLPDAETWIACTATLSAVRLESIHWSPGTYGGIMRWLYLGLVVIILCGDIWFLCSTSLEE